MNDNIGDSVGGKFFLFAKNNFFLQPAFSPRQDTLRAIFL
jgi:hypothetical protein